MSLSSRGNFARPTRSPEERDADRVVDKISRYAPYFKDIQFRHITFGPYHVSTMFGAGDFCHGLSHPDRTGPNRPGPKRFRT
jgi:phytoene dehydrogenase-like protein